jgi:hypothetical protein
MYKYIINEMATDITKYLDLSEEAMNNIVFVLKKYWEDKIATVWCVEDILDTAVKANIKLTDEQAKQVLMDLLRNFDAGIGINWSVIEEAISNRAQ